MEPLSFWAGVKIIYTYLPLFIKMVQRIDKMVRAGVEAHEINRKFEDIDKAFDPKVGQDVAAGQLDNVFIGRK